MIVELGSRLYKLPEGIVGQSLLPQSHYAINLSRILDRPVSHLNVCFTMFINKQVLVKTAIQQRAQGTQ
jgi:hypothetical protein